MCVVHAAPPHSGRILYRPTKRSVAMYRMRIIKQQFRRCEHSARSRACLIQRKCCHIPDGVIRLFCVQHHAQTTVTRRHLVAIRQSGAIGQRLARVTHVFSQDLRSRQRVEWQETCSQKMETHCMVVIIVHEMSMCSGPVHIRGDI